MAKQDLSDEVLRMDIVLNGNKAQKKLFDLQQEQKKLRKSNEDLRAAKQKLIAQGKKESAAYKEITTQIKANNIAIDENRREQQKQRKEIGLTALTTRQLGAESKRLRYLMANLIPNTPQWKQYNRELKSVNAQLGKVRAQMKGTAGVLDKIKNSFGGLFGTLLAGASVGAAFQGLKKLVLVNAELSDKQADVAKTTGLSSREIDQLTNSLKRMDTRTPIEGLLELATEAGRLGKDSVEDVEEFVRTADKIRVALGDDLQGDVNENVTLIGKLATQYKVGAKDGATFGESMEKVGSAINEVSASGSNQAGFLVDYLKRMVGVSSQANISAEDQLGFAAAFDEAGQSVEVAGTTMSKIITDMYTDASEFAKIAGLSTEEFNEILAKDGNEALLLFLEGLNGNGEGLQVMTKKMEELGLEGARSIATLTAIASNTDNVRKKQELASKAIAEGTSLQDEFNKKNENAAANLDKLGRRISEAFQKSVIRDFFDGMVKGLLEVTEATDDWQTALDKQGKKVVDLQKNLVPLVEEYENLENKTSLSKDEQARMSVLIQEISSVVPGAITAFDEYGNAMSISAGKARDFISTQKALLKFRNQDAIEQQTDQLKEYERQLGFLKNALNNFDTDGDLFKTVSESSGVGGVSVYDKKLTDEEIANLQASLAAQQELIVGAQASLDELSGDFLEKALQKEKEATEATLAELRTRADAMGIPYNEETTAIVLSQLIAAEERKLTALELARIREEEEAKKAAIAALARAEKNKKALQSLEESFIIQRENRLAESNEAQAKLDMERTLAKAKALGAEQALLDQIRAEHNILVDIAREEDQQKEIEALRAFEDRKRALLNEIALQNLDSEQARELLKEEQRLENEEIKLQRELEDLQLSEEQKNQLTQLLQESSGKAIDEIKEKWRSKELEGERKLAENKKKLLNDSLNAAIQVAGAETKVGKGLIIAKQLLAAKESAIALGLFRSKSQLAAAEAGTDIAKGTAKSASAAPFPANLPLIIGFAASVAGIISTITKLGKTKPKTQGFEDGLYPDKKGRVDVTRTDGKRFNAQYGGATRTGIVSQPTLFRDKLVAEAGPELIVDNKTLRRVNPSVLQHIYDVRDNRVRGFESGNFPKISTPTATDTPQTQEQLLAMTSMMMDTLTTLNMQLAKGINATALIGYQEAEDIEDLNKERDKSSSNGTLNS